MLINEAKWLNKIIQSLNLTKSDTVLNFGSSNQKYIKSNRHLLELVIKPLTNCCVLKNLDIQEGEGIDYSGNILDDNFYLYLKSIQFEGVLLNNVLEHVINYQELAYRVCQIIKPGGFLICSVPYRFPIHFDPIDNGFRPNVEELKELFKGFELVEGIIIDDFTYSYYLKSDIKLLFLTILRVLTPFYKFSKWKKVVLPKFCWFNEKFKVTCVLLKKEMLV